MNEFEKLKEVKEDKIESYLVSEVKKLRGRAYKFTSPGNAGVPDRICYLPEGISFLVETKKPKKKARPLQIVQANKLRALGQTVVVLDTKEKIDAFLSNYKKKSGG